MLLVRSGQVDGAPPQLAGMALLSGRWVLVIIPAPRWMVQAGSFCDVVCWLQFRLLRQRAVTPRPNSIIKFAIEDAMRRDTATSSVSGLGVFVIRFGKLRLEVYA